MKASRRLSIMMLMVQARGWVTAPAMPRALEVSQRPAPAQAYRTYNPQWSKALPLARFARTGGFAGRCLCPLLLSGGPLDACHGDP